MKVVYLDQRFEVSMQPHWLGIIGELLNFSGAMVLALDIFLRGRERARSRKLDFIKQVAIANGLNRTRYKGEYVASPDFPHTVLEHQASVIAYIGVSLLAVGFLMLVGYHWLELLD